tara:strand:+ start:925 stop:1131 length:207 start_codon:yes stop_codon:yes gene_type:complete
MIKKLVAEAKDAPDKVKELIFKQDRTSAKVLNILSHRKTPDDCLFKASEDRLPKTTFSTSDVSTCSFY